MRSANLALKFLLELAAFAALAVTGARIGSGAVCVVLAIVLPAVAIAVWARWNAPRSPHRSPTASRVPLELAVFAAAAVGLIATGLVVWGAVLAVLVAGNALLLSTLRQWQQ